MHQYTSLQHRRQGIERERESLDLNDRAYWNESRSNLQIINGFDCNLCVTVPISATGLDEIQVLLINRGMFGTYIR